MRRGRRSRRCSRRRTAAVAGRFGITGRWSRGSSSGSGPGWRGGARGGGLGAGPAGRVRAVADGLEAASPLLAGRNLEPAAVTKVHLLVDGHGLPLVVL